MHQGLNNLLCKSTGMLETDAVYRVVHVKACIAGIAEITKPFRFFEMLLQRSRYYYRTLKAYSSNLLSEMLCEVRRRASGTPRIPHD